MTEEEVATMIDAGEGQAVEFKEGFPEQARALAKEIAAFATSNSGIILIGVADNGTAVGLGTSDRGVLRSRIEGICHGTIKPPITPQIDFIHVQGQEILAVQVPKGAAPIYYVDNVPYLRHVSASRPADPQEVIDLILSWWDRQGAPAEDPELRSLEDAFNLVTSVLVVAAETNLPDRQLTPWLDDLQGKHCLLAKQTRELALRLPASLHGMRGSLSELSRSLDAAGYQRIRVNAGSDEMLSVVASAAHQAVEIRAAWILPRLRSEHILEQMIAGVDDAAARLADLADRLTEMDEHNRFGEIQNTAGEIGHSLKYIFASAPDGNIGARFEEVDQIGDALLNLETARMYVDGGQSAERVLAGVRDLDARLRDWLQQSI